MIVLFFILNGLWPISHHNMYVWIGEWAKTDKSNRETTLRPDCSAYFRSLIHAYTHIRVRIFTLSPCLLLSFFASSFYALLP